MKLLLLLINASRGIAALSILTGIVSGVASLYLITLVHRALSVDPPAPLSLYALFCTACAVVFACRASSQVLLTRLSQNSASRIRLQLCDRILCAPLAQLESIGSGRLLASLTTDSVTITDALSGIPPLCSNAVILLFGTIYLATLSPLMAAFAVLIATGGVMTHLTAERTARKYLQDGRNSTDGLMRQFQSLMSGIKELKSQRARREDFVKSILEPADEGVRRNLVIGRTIQSVSVAWGRVLVFIGLGLLLFVWPRIQPVTVAELTGGTLTILYLAMPLDMIVAWIPTLKHASIAFDKIEQLGLMLNVREDAQSASLDAGDWETIAFRSVDYSYQSTDGVEFRFGPIDLSIRRGEVIFVTGGNGSGKTTFAKLLTGLYSPNSGEIHVDGQPIDDANREGYRQLFSTVFVEGHVFDKCLGISPERLESELDGWTATLKIRDKVEANTGRLKNDAVSRGQQKRLALLVACLEDRPILMFDEWAAEQDPQSKDAFYRQILPLLKRRGQTVIAITHDDHWFSTADRVLKLRDGQLIECDEELPREIQIRASA